MTYRDRVKKETVTDNDVRVINRIRQTVLECECTCSPCRHDERIKRYARGLDNA